MRDSLGKVSLEHGVGDSKGFGIGGRSLPNLLFEVVKDVDVVGETAGIAVERGRSGYVALGRSFPECCLLSDYALVVRGGVGFWQDVDLLQAFLFEELLDAGKAAAVLALRRYRMCAWLVEVFSGETEMVEELRVMEGLARLG
jgi:hypothetical protein